MVIILDKDKAASVYFPKNIPNSELPDDVTVELIIWSELTQDRIAEDPEDLQYSSEIVYEFDLSWTVEHLKDGEYNYSIVGISGEGDIELGKGLLRIGNLVYTPKTNNKANRIIQYGE